MSGSDLLATTLFADCRGKTWESEWCFEDMGKVALHRADRATHGRSAADSVETDVDWAAS